MNTYSTSNTKCSQCGVAFYKKPSSIGLRNYCSRTCFNISLKAPRENRRSGVTRKCKICSTPFYVQNSRCSSAKKGIYCSKKCMYEGLKSPDRKCEYCGGDFHIKGNPRDRGKYCSRECSQKARCTGKIIICAFCGKSEYRKKNEVDSGNTLFCSIDCANSYQGRKKISYSCKVCAKEFKWSASRVKNSGYTPKYCSVKCRDLDPEFALNSYLKANLVQSQKKGLNKIEKIGKNILEKIGIEYKEQVLIAEKFLVDVFIESHDLVIQWDGDYWHGHPTFIKKKPPDHRQKRRMQLDLSQDAYMRKCGLKVIRFWESDVKNNPDKIKAMIQEILNEPVDLNNVNEETILDNK